MSLLSAIETSNAAIAEAAVKSFEALYSVDAILKRPVVSVEEAVYGTAGTDNDTTIGSRKVILTSSSFSDAGPQVFGLSEGQFIYTAAPDIQPGDTLELARQDNKPLNLKVIKSKGLGLTKIVLYQLEVSNLSIE